MAIKRAVLRFSAITMITEASWLDWKVSLERKQSTQNRWVLRTRVAALAGMSLGSARAPSRLWSALVTCLLQGQRAMDARASIGGTSVSWNLPLSSVTV